MEEGFDVAGEDNTSKKADASMELERILSFLCEEDSRLLDLVYLKAAGYTSQEIADHLGISRRTYVRLEQKMRSLARNARCAAVVEYGFVFVDRSVHFC